MKSSTIKSIGYDQVEQALEVEFQSGRIYLYRGVNPELHAWLMRAPSKMGLLNRLVIGTFPETEVSEVSPPQDLSDLLAKSLKETKRRDPE